MGAFEKSLYAKGIDDNLLDSFIRCVLRYSLVVKMICGSGRTFVVLAATAVLLLSYQTLVLANSNSVIVSTADSRLPMSLSTVLSDLEAEGFDQVSTACLITSRSVSRAQRQALLQEILLQGKSDDEEVSIQDKAIATTAGFALAQPGGSAYETASATCATGGTVLYYPAPTDLQRGEGLLDRLAPALEKILSSLKNTKKPTLYVLGDQNQVRAPLERAASVVLQNLVVPDEDETVVTSLDDIFAKIVYLAPSEAVAAVTQDVKTPPSEIASAVAEMWATQEVFPALTATSSFSSTSAADLSPVDLAAARKIGPAARLQLEETVEYVQSLCYNTEEENAGTVKLVPGFGELCDAAIKAATLEKEEDDDSSVKSSALGKQIRANFHANLEAAFYDMFSDQLNVLVEASFEDFKRSLSKLLISPNLQNDMEEAAKKSVAAFGAAAKKLVPKSCGSGWDTQSAKIQYARRLREYVANRILSARAGGKFKPLPRKGVTVGLHWLLPKPFGNDFRQEPWMVHATDNMVYVPSASASKLQDVSPGDVATGDWRDKIVPNPAGNDMLYMQ